MIFQDISRLRDCVYTKNKYLNEIEAWGNLTLAKWLAHDKNILPFIRNTIEFQYYIRPEHYYFILHFGIKKHDKAPWIPYPKKKKESEEEKLIEKVRDLLGWSKEELKSNWFVFEHEILKNEKYWKEKLGVK